MISYTDELAAGREDMLQGFLVGWPKRPSASQHLAVLRVSYRSVVAIDDAADRVAGFVTMLSDGVLTAFIPWLEVLPSYQGQGIGTELMRQMLEGTERLYSVDLVCDAALVPYYERFGMRGASSAALRQPAALKNSGPSRPATVHDPETPATGRRWASRRCREPQRRADDGTPAPATGRRWASRRCREPQRRADDGPAGVARLGGGHL